MEIFKYAFKMKITFFRTPSHRVFHYEPRYYDEREEKMRERYEKYGKDYDKVNDPYQVATPEEMEAEKERHYIPGKYIHNAYRNRRENDNRREGSSRFKSFIMILTLAAAVIVAYYLSQGLVELLSS
ncbi:MAG: hypothetical protein HUJ90_00425 [Bacteroidales bacterium]|nr:hypothetical protein [Bacteroidales bacterium]